MTSSSTEGRRTVRSVDLGSLARLALVVALGGAALVGPLLASTSARFTQEDQVGVVISVAPTPTPGVTP